jgi:hypothetical protein
MEGPVVVVAPLIWMVLAQAPATPLSGMVVGSNGEPVAGAEVLLAGLPVYDPPIVARGRTDAAGRFAIERPAGLAGESRFITPILWVVKPGYWLSFTRFAGPLPGPSEPLRVVLGLPGKAEVRVEGPDGAPVAGARVRVEWVGPAALHLPDVVEDLIETVTGKDGLAVIDAATNEDVTYVDVVCGSFGIQGRSFLPATSKPKRVRLRSPASLEGRLVADDPAMARGWQVSAYTRVGDPASRDPETTGFARGTTDDRGRFAFPVIAPGRLQLELKPPRDLGLLADIPGAVSVIGGRENAFEVPLRKAATITGLIRERGTGRPIAGAEVHLYPSGGGIVRTARTDEGGGYTFYSRPGPMTVSLFGTPPPHALGPGLNSRDVQVPANGAQVEVEPLEAIPAAPPLRFVVRDETGRPAARAVIRAQSSSRYMPRTANDRGEFAVPGLPPGGQVTVEVQQGGRLTDGPVYASAGRTDPVPVTIVPGLAIAMAGRVLGRGGAAIPDAVLKVEFRADPSQGGGFSFPQPVGFGEGDEFRTGPDGTFQTPREIYRKNRQFRVQATAEGFSPGATDWVSCEAGDLLEFPDLILRPSQAPRPIAGRVLDRQGRGVAGASVYTTIGGYRVTTDGAGRFRLAEVPGGTALVFAEKDGYRFGGAIVGARDASVDVRLARRDEPPSSIPKAQPPPLSRADERAMAREWLAPMVAAARAGSLGRLGPAVLPALARVDPDRVLLMIENRAVAPSPDVLHPVVLRQFESDPAAAVATIEADHDPAARAGCLLAIADAIPRADRARRIEWIDRALAEVRQVESKDPRLGLLGQVADRWLDLGLLDRARPVLREGRSIIATMPEDAYSPAAEPFAEVLAAIDLPTARPILGAKVMTNVGGDIADMVKGQLAGAAIRLAATDPAEAERLVTNAFPNFSAASPDVLQICRRMARADLPRARRILDAIERFGRAEFSSEPEIKPAGLGLMAMELAEFDPGTSRRLLDETFDRLRALASEGNPFRRSPISTLMAALLPIVERIDPDRLEERLWLTAAVGAPVFDSPFLNSLQPPIVLAMLVSRYDRTMADSIIAPALERLPGKVADSSGLLYNNTSTPIKALAAYDPRAVVVLLRALPESARRPANPKDEWYAGTLDDQIRVAAAETLGWPIEHRRGKVLEGDVWLRLFALDR